MAPSREELTLFDDYYEMMSDDVRMGAYEEAIRRVVRPSDVVVDLGAGLGILSFLCVRAGAARVYAIEKMDSVHLARRVAADNGMADRIVFLEEGSKRCHLPEKADVLVSETLGSFAVDENTLDFTLDARERFLKPGGRLLPERLRMWLCPVHSPDAHGKLAFWEDVGGIRFTAAIQEKLSRLSLEDLPKRSQLSSPQVFAEVDLRTFTSPVLEGQLRFDFQRGGVVHGLGGWFEADLCEDVVLHTGPGRPTTHWKQAFFPFREPVRVGHGDHMVVALSVAPRSEEGDDTVVSYQYFCSQEALEHQQDVPRNAPCPCGSGRKHKRCCGREGGRRG